MPSVYQQRILFISKRAGCIIDPAVVEAWMRMERPSLDGLSPTEFTVVAVRAIACAQSAGPAANAALAASFGLKTWTEADLINAQGRG